MRHFLIATAGAMLLAGPASEALGQSVTESGQPIRSSLLQAVVVEIDSRSGRTTDPQLKAWLSELAGHYRAPGAVPQWLDEQGYTMRGVVLYAALEHADDYALDPTLLGLPPSTLPSLDEAILAEREVALSLAATTYAWHARGGRVDPSRLSLWLDQRPRGIYASEVLRRLTGAESPAEALTAFNPSHPQFEMLRQAWLSERQGTGPAARLSPLVIPDGPNIRRGQRHPHVALVRKALDLDTGALDADLADDALIDAVHDFMYDLGQPRKFSIDGAVRAALNDRQGGAYPATGGGRKEILDKIAINMERWRWMPESLGDLYVWNNLPEFLTRVVRNGEVIHEERIVVGTTKTQTPVFSDAMSKVIFHPEWGVPESIKIRQLLPSLKGGDFSVLSRRNMRIWDGQREIKPSKLNWAKINIRDVPIVQRAGSGNPLGQLKFIFPNSHDVYMHDTPSKDLFNTRVRTHSHGCIRVRNPQRFAEVILGETKGWTATDVQHQLDESQTIQIRLDEPVPVHNTYFTLRVDEAGQLLMFPDVYGHDQRIGDALAGKSIKDIAARDPALALKQENKELALAPPVVKPVVRKLKPQVASFGLKPWPTAPAPPPAYLKKAPQKPKPTFFLFQ